MDHSTHTPLMRSEMTEQALVDAPIYDHDDQKVGTISHLHGHGTVTEVVIDVGGFLGIGAKPVLVSVDQLSLMRDANGRIHGLTSWTKDQFQALPEHHH